MGERTAGAVAWLLAAEEPAVRLTRRHLMGEDSAPNRATITAGPWVSALLAVPATDPRVAAAAEHVLAWIVNNLKYPPRVVDGLPRSHASVQGNALGACARLGLAGDERTERLAEAIISWQWPDGGWNCVNRADGHRSSFHESLRTAWGLQEYAAATGHAGAREAANRAVELFLQHRIFRRGGTGEPINARWLTDPRASDALDLLEKKRDRTAGGTRRHSGGARRTARPPPR